MEARNVTLTRKDREAILYYIHLCQLVATLREGKVYPPDVYVAVEPNIKSAGMIIKEAIATGAVAWEELGLHDERDFEELLILNNIKWFRKASEDIKNGSLSPSDIEHRLRCLRAALAAGTITRQQLG